jgi:hypothetical protein
MGLAGDVRRRCLCQYGSTLRWLGRLEESLAVLDDAQAEFPNSESVHVFRGHCRYKDPYWLQRQPKESWSQRVSGVHRGPKALNWLVAALGEPTRRRAYEAIREARRPVSKFRDPCHQDRK